MDMYGQKSPSWAQKFIIVTLELLLIAVSWLVLFGPILPGVRAFGDAPDLARNATLFAFNLVVFARFILTLFVFMERRIPWEEALSLPFAFALYLLGFPLLARSSAVEFGLVEALGTAQRFVAATLRNTANPSRLDAGYKTNVVPGRATAELDTRFLPGQEDEVRETIARLAGPRVRVETIHADVALEVPFAGDLVDAMAGALVAEDPDAVVLPYALSAGTDNKSLSRLGITGYGFAPVRLPADLDFPALFHGVDERVPVDALGFGARVLGRLLTTY